jgi:hypothetical protein
VGTEKPTAFFLRNNHKMLLIPFSSNMNIAFTHIRTCLCIMSRLLEEPVH